jgi:hypothetical protein
VPEVHTCTVARINITTRAVSCLVESEC